jgi:NAD(P)-dependent dehydrogenase (short-subunit alcohol dehydrogenase family)
MDRLESLFHKPGRTTMDGTDFEENAPLKRLAGQVAWISGGASGMGEAITRLFAAEGARVALIDIQMEPGQRVVEEIAGQGGRAIFLECDVTLESQVRDSLERTVAHFGGLQIVVNCAGIVHVGPLHQYTEAEWDYLMGVNLKSVFFSLKHGLADLSRNKRSYMVNIASVSSFIGQANTPAYIASKHAVMGLSRAIALDYASVGLRCNAICPGITDTPMLRSHLNTTPDPEATLANRLRRVPIGIALQPLDIARAALYFSCEDSAGVTGTSLVIDGGYTATAEWETGGHTRFME